MNSVQTDGRTEGQTTRLRNTPATQGGRMITLKYRIKLTSADVRVAEKTRSSADADKPARRG